MTLLLWCAICLALWSMLNTFFTVILFFGKSDGVYRAMQLYMTLTTLMLIRTTILMFFDVVSNPEYYCNTVIAAAIIAPAGTLSAAYLAYQMWRARKND